MIIVFALAQELTETLEDEGAAVRAVCASQTTIRQRTDLNCPQSAMLGVFRHVYGTAARRELSYDNVKVSGNAWDTNLIKVNPVGVSFFLCSGCMICV